MPETVFARSLLRSLATIRRDVPWLYVQMREALGDRRVRLRVDGEALDLTGGEDDVTAQPPSEEADVIAVSTTQHILRVLDGELTLEEAILADEIEIYGEVESILRFHDALRLYVQGAVRSPRVPGQLRRLREEAGA